MPINAIQGHSALAMLQSQDALAAELGGDANAQVAAMLLKHSQDKQASLRVQRVAEEEQLTAMEEEQVDQMRESAEQIRIAAREKAIGQITNGICQIGGGIVALDGTDGGKAAGEIWQGAGDGADGVANLEAAEHEYAQGIADADAKQAEHMANEAGRRLDDIKDEERNARELVRTALDFLREVRGAGDQANKAALFQRV